VKAWSPPPRRGVTTIRSSHRRTRAWIKIDDVEEIIQVKSPFDPQKHLESELMAETIAAWKEQLYKALVDEFRGVRTRKILRRILNDDNNDGLGWLLSSASEKLLKKEQISLYLQDLAQKVGISKSKLIRWRYKFRKRLRLICTHNKRLEEICKAFRL
jgi:DNA-binding Xre family transcriptional regulator